MKKVRCKKQYGVWYYEKEMQDSFGELDGDLWHLYNENGEYEMTFPFYGDMILYIETGEVL